MGYLKYAYIYRLNTKIRLTMLCLSGFEQNSRWVPLSHLFLIPYLGSRWCEETKDQFDQKATT